MRLSKGCVSWRCQSRANVQRSRRKPEPPEAQGALNNSPSKGPRTGPNLVELALVQYHTNTGRAAVNAAPDTSSNTTMGA